MSALAHADGGSLTTVDIDGDVIGARIQRGYDGRGPPPGADGGLPSLSVVIQYFWFALVVVVLVVAWRTGAFKGLFDRVTKVSGPGFEFDFTQATALKTRGSVESELVPIRAIIDRGVQADVRAHALQQVFGSVLDKCMGQGSYRATVHIPDPLFENWLYQLLDYHPSGQGSGRRFDARGGLIGLAWRTGVTQALRADGVSTEDLVSRWGMTSREASARQVGESRSLLAAVLTDTEGLRRIGILYLDSVEANRFGATEEAMEAFGQTIVDACKPQLSSPLTAVVTNALRSSPQLVLEQLA